MTQSNENRNKTDDEQRILIVPVKTQLRQSEDFIHSYRPVLLFFLLYNPKDVRHQNFTS